MAPFLKRSANGFDPIKANGEAMLTNGELESSHQQNGLNEGPNDNKVDIEFLIVGAGPAGAALACFLASYGEFYSLITSCLVLWQLNM